VTNWDTINNKSTAKCKVITVLPYLISQASNYYQHDHAIIHDKDFNFVIESHIVLLNAGHGGNGVAVFFTTATENFQRDVHHCSAIGHNGMFIWQIFGLPPSTPIP